MTTKPFSKNNVGGFNAISAMIASALENVSTCSLVQVMAVYPNPDGGLLAGTVDVQPLVNQIDDSGTPTSHGTICGLPYFQLQGGSSALILTPAEGDIGMAGFCDRDISSALTNKAPSNPGSFRLFDKADGIYFGGVANGAALQFIQFLSNAAGINMQSDVVSTSGNLDVGTGATGTATDSTGQTLTFKDGILVNIF